VIKVIRLLFDKPELLQVFSAAPSCSSDEESPSFKELGQISV
jgi:hypothetical protein